MSQLAPSPESFFRLADPTPDGAVPRDQWDRPLILPRPGEVPKYTTGKNAGYTPYARASSFGQQIEDITNLVKWQKRQVARGIALMYEKHELRLGRDGGLPYSPFIEPSQKAEKQAWDAMAKRAEDAVGSYAKAEIGTAIHKVTEMVDLGEPIHDLPELLQNRAIAYWKFCKEWGITPRSVEQFGVEDVHQVAGTWDRTGWVLNGSGGLCIIDVKTGSTMDFAGIGFAVQLAEYAHAEAYDPATGARTPHEGMNTKVAWIIHVGREMDEPVEMFDVNIEVGWQYAQTVNEVIQARRDGTKAIKATRLQIRDIVMAQSRAELEQLDRTGWTATETELATHRWRALPKVSELTS